MTEEIFWNECKYIEKKLDNLQNLNLLILHFKTLIFVNYLKFTGSP